MKNDYEEKKQDRINRYKELAEKNKTKAEQMIKSNDGKLTKIHSVSEINKKAEYYRNKVIALENNTTISSDDPEAIRKLKGKLALLKKRKDLYMRINKDYKLFLKTGNGKQIDYLTPLQMKMIADNMALNNYKIPYPAYELSNLNQNIRATKKRLEKLVKQTGV